MTFKVLEVRDSGTHIGVLAIRMLADNNEQAYEIHDRAGHPRDGASIVLMCLDNFKATNDPYEWTSLGLGPRTMPVAHNYIVDHYDELADGQVIDVEYLLGETATPKTSERLS